MIINGKDDNEVLSFKELKELKERDMPSSENLDIEKRIEILENAMQELIISTMNEGE